MLHATFCMAQCALPYLQGLLVYAGPDAAKQARQRPPDQSQHPSAGEVPAWNRAVFAACSSSCNQYVGRSCDMAGLLFLACMHSDGAPLLLA